MKKIILLNSFLLILQVFIFIPNSFSASGALKIIDMSGRPIPGIHVAILIPSSNRDYRYGGTIILEKLTNRSGYIYIQDSVVPNGDYAIWVNTHDRYRNNMYEGLQKMLRIEGEGIKNITLPYFKRTEESDNEQREEQDYYNIDKEKRIKELIEIVRRNKALHKEPKENIKYFIEVIRLKPDDRFLLLETYEELAKAYYYHGYFEEGKAVDNDIIKLDPNGPYGENSRNRLRQLR